MGIKCPKCHHENPDDTLYCGKCASPLKSVEEISITKTLITPTERLQKGSTIAGKYQILEELGKGGMGVVYKVADTKLKRTVALKFLSPELTKDREAKERFIQEAQAAAALEHPNICTVYEVDEADGQSFIAMSYIEGQSLKDKLKEGSLTINEAKDIALQVAEGLKEAHEKGIVHRDIKPANIMLTEKDQAKITDFGLAKLSWGVDLTKTSTIMGTVAYMSPEQARGEEVDHRTDIWSLGAMLYEMLMGERPFKKDREHALIYSILNEEPEPLSSFRSDIPNHIIEAIQKALEKDASKRYQSMQELVKGLIESSPITFPKAEKSIVVLPFDDMSPDKDNEYFSDGLTEEIISDLSQIHDLLVISRSTATTYKGTKKKIMEIGKELNVQFVLEGSVRKAGNNLRITAQLIDAKNDVHLWAEKYKGTLEDVFDIQEEVSRKIADALKLKLSPKEDKYLAERSIDNVKVYEYYLKALEKIIMFTEDSINSALRYLQNAVDIMGDNALLYCAMAWAHWNLVNIGAKQEDYLAKAEEYAKKALLLDAESSVAHVILGFIDSLREKTLESLPRFKKALQINQDEIMAIAGIVNVYQFAGKISEGDPYSERLTQLDPLSFPANWLKGGQYYYDGQFDLALQAWRRLYKLHPENPFSHFTYGLILAYTNELEEAISIIDQNTEKNPDTLFSKLGLILKYALQGKNEKVLKEITPDFEKTVRRDPQFSHYLSSFLALVNQKKEALNWLENAVNNGLINYPFLAEKDPFLENIRGEERFKKLMKRVKHEWEKFEV